MRHILQWIFVFAAALASVFTLQSCGLEEPFPGPQSGISEGTVEFVARPAGYNNHDVTTKADGDFDDAEIHNAFLILFNKEGKRILFEEINIDDDGHLTAITDRALGEVVACVLANVPESFAKGIIGPTNPGDGEPDQYINTAVLKDLTYNHSISKIVGVPLLNLNGRQVACIPMYGTTGLIDLSKTSSAIPVTLSRLFSKITVKLKLEVELGNENYQNTLEQSINYKLNSWTLYNIPNKVKLTTAEDDEDNQSAWIKETNPFSTGITVSVNKTIRNKDADTEYSFDFYAPEYFLDPIDNPSADQRNKPKNFHSDTKPIYVHLAGEYNAYLVTTATINYNVYLGRDHIDDFSLERNVHYTNTLTILGVNENADPETTQGEVDHRVTSSTIINPVAKSGTAANCYVISKTGEWSFPAYKGAYNDLNKAVACEGGEYVEIIANKAQYEQTDVSKISISKLTYDKETNMVSFNVDKIKVLGREIDVVPNGNVVIALKDVNHEIIWSWHLWFVTDFDGSDESGWAQMKDEQLSESVYMIDRNLGAVEENGIGCYYRYGRKEPFISDDYKGGGKNGNYTWVLLDENDNEIDGGKSVYDPCPPGYRVPTNVWVSGKGKSGTTKSIFNYNSEIQYPYSGFLKSDKKSTLTSAPIADKETTSTDFTREHSDASTSREEPGGFKYPKTRKKTTDTYYYSNFKYKTSGTRYFGYYWSSSSELNSFYYEFAETSAGIIVDRVDIISYDVKKITIVETQKKESMFGSWQTTNTEELEPEYYSENYSANFYNMDWPRQLCSHEKNKGTVNSFEGHYYKFDSNDPDYPDSDSGLQVRCLSENRR